MSLYSQLFIFFILGWLYFLSSVWFMLLLPITGFFNRQFQLLSWVKNYLAIECANLQLYSSLKKRGFSLWANNGNHINFLPSSPPLTYGEEVFFRGLSRSFSSLPMQSFFFVNFLSQDVLVVKAKFCRDNISKEICFGFL